MFRSHEDMVRKPIVIEKLETEPKTNKAITDVYKCEICGERWLTETDVDIHRRKVHYAEIITSIKNENEHFCLICVRAQGSADNLISHIKSDHLLSSPTAHRVEREIYICDYCENIFFNKKLLTAHIQYVHRDKSKRGVFIPCPMCDKSYNSDKMWFHFNFHLLNINSSCQICMASCTANNRHREHLLTHPYYYHCETCNVSVNKRKFFNEHIEMHKRRNPQRLRGDLKRFFTPRLAAAPWKFRLQSRIKGLQLFDLSVCILCREICVTAAEKRRHMLVDHAPELEVKQKPTCVCGEEFFNMVLLKHHIFKLKGEHRHTASIETPSPSTLGLFDEPTCKDFGEHVLESPSVRALIEVPTPVDSELFTVQDLAPTEDEIIIGT